MLKKWIAEVLALAISLSSGAVLEGALSTDTKPSREIVQEIDTSYQRGDYDDFLQQMHEHYQTAGKAGALRGIFESAKATMPKPQHDIVSALKLQRSELAKLDKERNEKLLEVISGNPDLAIVQKVDTIVFSSPTPEQDILLAELDVLKFHIPETAKLTIENKISALETEYYIKSLLLDIGSMRAEKEPTDIEKKKIILQLAKLDKMEQAAKDLSEKKWLDKIKQTKVGFRAEKAFRMDYSVLMNLANGKVIPQNTVEENVKQIMIEYLQQKDQILTQLAQK